MRITLSALALAACSTSTHAPPAAPPSVPVVPALAVTDLTVALVDAGPAGRVSLSCSGVWVAPTLFATAAHCVDDRAVGATVEYVTRPDLPDDLSGGVARVVRLGTVAAVDEPHDVALVRAHYVAHRAAQLNVAPYAGQQVQTMGHPLGFWYSYSVGVVAQVRRDDDGMWWVQSTAPISPGNSGGGLFDLDGRLLGVCSRYYKGGQLLNMYAHVMYVRAAMLSLEAPVQPL